MAKLSGLKIGKRVRMRGKCGKEAGRGLMTKKGGKKAPRSFISFIGILASTLPSTSLFLKSSPEDFFFFFLACVWFFFDSRKRRREWGRERERNIN